MKIVQPGYEILDAERLGPALLQKLERCGRTAYKSEAKTGPGTAETFVAMLKARGHWSVLEHESVSVRIVCDRGVSHELVRHRLASYTQESTRYCRYQDEIAVIEPLGLTVCQRAYWRAAVEAAESSYMEMLGQGAKPEIARSVLPTCLKTEIVVTANLREWHHIFRLRTAKAAHPQMRQIMLPLLAEFRRRIPVLYDDLPEVSQ